MAFEDWWRDTGHLVDPDTADVPWFDKREGLARDAYQAGREELWPEVERLQERGQEADERLARKTSRIEELASICERLDNLRMAAMHAMRRSGCRHDEWVAKVLEILESAEEPTP